MCDEGTALFLCLARGDRDDLAAYIMSLRKEGVRP
jgi:hypothetical protein